MTAPSLFALALMIAVSLGSVPDKGTLMASASVPPGMPDTEFAAGLAEPLDAPVAAPTAPLAEAVAAHSPAEAPSKADGEVILAAMRSATAAATTATHGTQVVQLAEDGPDSVRVVTASRLNVRAEPGTGADVVDQLSRGDFATVVAEGADGWVKVRLEGDGMEGWVAGRFLSAE